MSLAPGEDSVTPSNVPDNEPVVGFYIDGRYAWPADAIAAHTGVHISITVKGNTSAICADCESGDLTPTAAAAWARARISLGFRPLIYCSESAQGAVIAALNALHVNLGLVDWWIAAYPGIGPVLYPGTEGHQYADTGPVDLSVWQPGFVPGARITPVTQEAALSNFPNAVAAALTSSGNGAWVAGSDGGVFCVGDAQEYGSLPGLHDTPAAPIVDIVRSAGGHGYYLLGADGGVFAFGDAGEASPASYPALPAAEREGERSFGGGCLVVTGPASYVLVALDGSRYAFGSG